MALDDDDGIELTLLRALLLLLVVMVTVVVEHDADDAIGPGCFSTAAGGCLAGYFVDGETFVFCRLFDCGMCSERYRSFGVHVLSVLFGVVLAVVAAATEGDADIGRDSFQLASSMLLDGSDVNCCGCCFCWYKTFIRRFRSKDSACCWNHKLDAVLRAVWSTKTP